MSLKGLTQLSHFITMMFGIALGMTLCLLYQHMVKIIIFDLSSNEENIKVISHKLNLGKGAALRSGITADSGDVVIIQDADLEYDPSEFDKLLKPIQAG